MDEELLKAVVSGDVEFLKKCEESNKPIDYYLTFVPQSSDENDDVRGNIFHIAAYNNREDFIREAIRILPSEDTQKLLLQTREPFNANPLHVAGDNGNVEIVKMFLNVYRCLPSLPSDISKRPWLLKNSEGNSPCQSTVYGFHEECALEMLKTDMELISNMTSERDSSLLYEVVHNKLSKLALEMLSSPHSFPCNGNDGYTPFHSIHNFNCSEEAKDIFRLLLQRAPEVLKQQTDNGFSIFHLWASGGKLWPFKHLVESHVIIPNVKEIFAHLVSTTNKYGDNPFHSLTEDTSNEEVAIEIAKLLIDTYKQVESSAIIEDLLPWLVENNDGDTPLSLAITPQYEKFALYILSIDENAVIKSQNNVLFLAIENGCYKVAQKILKIVDDNGWNQLLTNHHHNVLHLAPLCTSESASLSILLTNTACLKCNIV
ncbi:uncharacterized protein [Spinacia oleracea]|uniref:Uncharacterized protein n=1 Tax=Spinacia oleracea TaxID=3562 RepID=A0ABM3RP40_SPIOL|nr:uncharacterized protein LOC110794702 [Spinacia oleracea]